MSAEQNSNSTVESSQTLIIESGDEENQPREVPTLRLRLRKPKSQKQVKFDASTVDNEHLNKKKSKCCCIYTKPHKFGESSSESEDECENCYGHVEKRHRNHQPSDPSPQDEGPSDHTPVTGP